MAGQRRGRDARGRDTIMGRESAEDKPGRRWRVFLADPHVLMRSAAAQWINASGALRVCGLAGGMAKALREIDRLRPDIVVTEIMRPQDLGFIQELHRRQAHLPILIFTIQEKALFKGRAEKAGAAGYVMKGAGGNRLVQSIRAVLRRHQKRRMLIAGRGRGCGRMGWLALERGRVP